MDELAYWIAFNRVPGVGPTRLRALLDFFDEDIEAAWQGSSSDFAQVGLDKRTIQSILKHRAEISLEHELELLEQHQVQAITWNDPEYPKLLHEIDFPPFLLYVRGQLLPDDDWAVAVVGTRKMSPYGRQATEYLVQGLAEAGLTIVSGLALGVDGVAHHTALQSGGRTIAVLGNGVERPYPARNRNMAEAIVAEGRGALISDYPIGTKPEAKNFPPRNRIISGLALGTIIIEAGRRSGASITAAFAREQNRELFALPGNIFSPVSQGPNKLITEGATPAISVEAVLQSLDMQMIEPQKVVRQVITASPQEEQILNVLSSEALHIDEIGQRCELTTAELLSTLALMELKGLVRQAGVMNFIKV